MKRQHFTLAAIAGVSLVISSLLIQIELQNPGMQRAIYRANSAVNLANQTQMWKPR